jgi:hypothetical protein
MSTSNLRIRYSDMKALMPGTFTTFSLANLRNYNLNTAQSGKLLLSQLKSSYAFPTINAPSSSFGRCYSVRLVVSTYTGPVFQVRRSSDNLLQTFYTDDTQSYLTTGSNNTGTTFSNWIVANTAYVYVWYDQSTNANNASNSVNGTTQPNISLQNSKYVIQFQNANSTVLNIATSYSPYTIFCNFYNTNSAYGTIITSSRDYELRFGGGGGIFINGDSNGADWFFSAGGTKIGYNNGSESTAVLVGGWNLLSLTGTTLSNPSINFQIIGKDNIDNTRGINGYMTEIIYINKTVTANDMVQYYNYRLFKIIYNCSLFFYIINYSCRNNYIII